MGQQPSCSCQHLKLELPWVPRVGVTWLHWLLGPLRRGSGERRQGVQLVHLVCPHVRDEGRGRGALFGLHGPLWGMLDGQLGLLLKPAFYCWDRRRAPPGGEKCKSFICILARTWTQAAIESIQCSSNFHALNWLRS